MRKNRFLLAATLSALLSMSAQAATLLGPPTETSTKTPDVPPGLDFVRTFEAQLTVGHTASGGLGAQSILLRSRYLDPDVNAFVGIVGELYHFNQDLRIGDPLAPDTAGVYGNLGINLGLRRGKSTWELDLMASLLSSSFGPAVAIEGDHSINKHWGWYHRTALNLFTEDDDIILNSNQGLYWQNGHWGVMGGYRIFGGRHVNRNGFNLGIRWLFETPKIPFIFPSLG